jgi:hypothetical protein
MAAAAVFLASDMASYITGHSLAGLPKQEENCYK